VPVASPPAAVVDLHGHWFPAEVAGLAPPAGLPDAVRSAWPLLTDAAAQADAAAEAGIDVRVLDAPLSSLLPPDAGGRLDVARRVNDALAGVVAEHGPRLAALGTVDAYAGDAGAEEARRAVEELGLAGIVVDAARGELLLDAAEARPTLDYAAERGATVFLHPVSPPAIPPRYAALPEVGVLALRGTEAAISVLALLRSGTLDALPGLSLVTAGIGAHALLLAGFLDGDGTVPSAARSRIHVDTMGFDAAAIRATLAIVGPERVVVGSDWPIIDRNAGRDRVGAVLAEAGLDAADRERVAWRTAAALLGLDDLGAAAARREREGVR